MSAAVMSPTPALPSTRKPSVWEKMVSGFKSSNKKLEVPEVNQPLPSPTFDTAPVNGDTMFSGFNLGGRKQSVSPAPATVPGSVEVRRRQMSTTTGVEKDAPTMHQRHGSTATTATRAGSVAAPSIRSTRTSASRAGSFSSQFSRRGSKWWSSSNPEDEAPPVPTIDRKYSMFGSHNPDVEDVPMVTPPQSRRPSYVPRNAAGSFLKTTSQKAVQPTKTEMENVNRKLSVAGSTRQGSIAASSRTGSSGSITAPPALKAGEIKTVDLRKDSTIGVEKVGMYSMAGICDIIEDVNEADEEDLSPSCVEKKTNPVETLAVPVTVRTDSAKGSPELLATKTEAQREPSLLEENAVVV